MSESVKYRGCLVAQLWIGNFPQSFGSLIADVQRFPCVRSGLYRLINGSAGVLPMGPDCRSTLHWRQVLEGRLVQSHLYKSASWIGCSIGHFIGINTDANRFWFYAE